MPRIAWPGADGEALRFGADVEDEPAPGLEVRLRLAGGARREHARDDLVRRRSPECRRRPARAALRRQLEAGQVRFGCRILRNEIGVRGEIAHGAHHVGRRGGRKQRDLAAHDRGAQHHREAIAVGAEVEHVPSRWQRRGDVPHVSHETRRGDRLAAPVGGDGVCARVRDQRMALRIRGAPRRGRGHRGGRPVSAALRLAPFRNAGRTPGCCRGCRCAPNAEARGGGPHTRPGT